MQAKTVVVLPVAKVIGKVTIQLLTRLTERHEDWPYRPSVAQIRDAG
jgi:hypothetical protein